MKKNLLILVMFLLCSRIYAQSPSFAWVKAIGMTGFDDDNNVALDDSGNVYTTGYFQGTVDFDPGAGTFNLTSAGYYDIFITKLDANGKFIWAKAMGGRDNDNIKSIVLDALGNIYTTGYFVDTADFDPGAGTYNLISASTGFADIFISKLDANGKFIWAKRMGGTIEDYGNSIAVDISGNVYTTGYFEGTADFDPGAGTFNLTSGGIQDIFILKLDTAGKFVWAKAIGGSGYDQSNSIVLDDSGHIYTKGYFQGIVDFDPGAGTSNLTAAGISLAIFISKLDTAGKFVWAKAMSGIGSDADNSIVLDTSGNVYFMGYFQGTADFDPGAATFNLTSAGDADIFVLKLDTAGKFVWAKVMGGTNGDAANAIALDDSGNVYTTGYFQGTADFDPGAATFNLTSVGARDIFISKLNAAGKFVWAKAMGGIYTDVGNSIALDSLGNVYTTGYFADTVDFNPGAGTFNLTSAGGSIFVHKMKDCAPPATPGSISGNATVCSGSSNTYSITAVSGATSYTWVLPGGWSGTSTTDSITTTASATSGNISVTANNACGSSAAQILSVTVNSIPATPGTISGNATVCSGSPNTYSITAVSGATSYTWVMPGGWSGTSTTNSITTTASATSGNISVTANNACGFSLMKTLAVTVNTVNTSVSQSGKNLTANATGATYQWINCTANTPISGQTNQSFTATANGNYAVIVTISGCSDTSSCFNIANVGIAENNFANTITIYPNPGCGVFTLSLPIMHSLPTAISLVNTLGQVIYSGMLQSQVKQFDFSYLPPATYHLLITNDGEQIGIGTVVITK